MDTSTHADTQTRRIHPSKKKKKKKEKKKGRNNTCRDENLSRTINALMRPENSVTNPGTKTNNLIKTVTTK